ncbi:9638_t:CDS:2 [Entrophospora sp. SA101]|nr:9638_t:CDS:2 [Entrophospora sp. SA101]
MSTTVIMTNVNNLDNYSSALRRNQHKLYENIKLSPSPLFHQQEDQRIYVDEELGYNIYKNKIKHDTEINDDDKEIEIKVDDTDDKDLGFEPVLVPNDTKAQTVTNLLESTKPVSAVPNVSRMLPDTDVRLPSYALPCAKKPPRPPNAFILYRRAKQPAIVAKNVGISNNDVSKEIGKMWHEEPVEIRLKYQKMAEAAKEEHTKKYPEYRYRPRRPQERKRRLLTRGKDNVEGSEVGGKAAKRLRRSSAYVLAQRQTQYKQLQL